MLIFNVKESLLISLSYLRRKVLEAWENGHEQSTRTDEGEEEEESKSENENHDDAAAQSDS